MRTMILFLLKSVLHMCSGSYPFLPFKNFVINHHLFFLHYQSFSLSESFPSIFIHVLVSSIKKNKPSLNLTFLCLPSYFYALLYSQTSPVLSTYAMYLFSPLINSSTHDNLNLPCHSTKTALKATNHLPYCQSLQTQPFTWSLSSIWHSSPFALFLKHFPFCSLVLPSFSDSFLLLLLNL